MEEHGYAHAMQEEMEREIERARARNSLFMFHCGHLVVPSGPG